MTDTDLEKDLTITVRLHRVKILEAIKKLQTQDAQPRAVPPKAPQQPAPEAPLQEQPTRPPVNPAPQMAATNMVAFAAASAQNQQSQVPAPRQQQP